LSIDIITYLGTKPNILHVEITAISNCFVVKQNLIKETIY